MFTFDSSHSLDLRLVPAYGDWGGSVMDIVPFSAGARVNICLLLAFSVLTSAYQYFLLLSLTFSILLSDTRVLRNIVEL